jgi:hypothetical protein
VDGLKRTIGSASGSAEALEEQGGAGRPDAGSATDRLRRRSSRARFRLVDSHRRVLKGPIRSSQQIGPRRG